MCPGSSAAIVPTSRCRSRKRLCCGQVAAAGKPLVVVLMNGSALAANWEKAHADAILESWYSGEEGGAAIADTLSGKSDPAGRLPVTFYEDVNQLPNFEDYSMKGRTYRYFTGEPLWPFGYGLSYTTFKYGGLILPKAPIDAGSSGECGGEGDQYRQGGGR